MEYTADIGVIGGSGFYSLLENANEIQIDTPYGPTSDNIIIGNYAGKSIAFLPRHNRNHSIPPHLVPYRANMYAMKQLGVKKIIGPNASGSLQPHVKPGDFVVIDQFVDRTSGRKDTFFDGPEVRHISSAYCYCNDLRKIAIDCITARGITCHPTGTVVVIQGPRFSTVAESRWFSSMGWEVINMTQYPEGYLARELGMCYVNISLITDYDAGLEGRDDIVPVTHEAVLKVFEQNNDKIKNVIFDMIERIDINSSCTCQHME